MFATSYISALILVVYQANLSHDVPVFLLQGGDYLVKALAGQQWLGRVAHSL